VHEAVQDVAGHGGVALVAAPVLQHTAVVTDAALGRPALLPVRQELVLLHDGLKAMALQGRGLGAANGVLGRTLAVGVAHPRRVGHHAAMRPRQSLGGQPGSGKWPWRCASSTAGLG